jgi:hypothetical protein
VQSEASAVLADLRVRRSEASAVLPEMQGVEPLRGLLLSAEDH